MADKVDDKKFLEEHFPKMADIAARDIVNTIGQIERQGLSLKEAGPNVSLHCLDGDGNVYVVHMCVYMIPESALQVSNAPEMPPIDRSKLN